MLRENAEKKCSERCNLTKCSFSFAASQVVGTLENGIESLRLRQGFQTEHTHSRSILDHRSRVGGFHSMRHNAMIGIANFFAKGVVRELQSGLKARTDRSCFVTADQDVVPKRSSVSCRSQQGHLLQLVRELTSVC